MRPCPCGCDAEIAAKVNRFVVMVNKQGFRLLARLPPGVGKTTKWKGYTC
jgi:hypothetical protein